MGSVRYRYIAPDGKERVLLGSRDLLEAIREGHVTEATMLFDVISERWQRAEDSEAYSAVKEFLSDIARADGDAQHPVDPPSPQASTDPADMAESTGPESSESPTAAVRPHGSFQPASALTWVFVVVWAVLSYLGERTSTQSEAAAYGYVLGQGLFLGLLGALAARFLGKGHPQRAWAVVAGVFAFGGLNSYLEANRNRADVQAMMSTIIQAQTTTDRIPTGSDSSSMNFVIASYANDSNGSWERYNAVVARIDEDLLASTTLVSSAGRERTSLMIVALRAAAQELASSLEEAIQVASDRFGRLERQDVTLRGVTAGFNGTVPTTQRLIRQFIDVELRFCDEVEDLLSLLASDPPTLGADGSTLLFARDVSVQTFDNHLASLQALIAEEDEAVRALRLASLTSISRADSLRTHIR